MQGGGDRVIVVKVDVEFHKKARGQIIASGKFLIPSDKKDAVVPYSVLLHDTRGELVATLVAHWKISFKENAKKDA